MSVQEWNRWAAGVQESLTHRRRNYIVAVLLICLFVPAAFAALPFWPHVEDVRDLNAPVPGHWQKLTPGVPFIVSYSNANPPVWIVTNSTVGLCDTFPCYYNETVIEYGSLLP